MNYFFLFIAYSIGSINNVFTIVDSPMDVRTDKFDEMRQMRLQLNVCFFVVVDKSFVWIPPKNAPQHQKHDLHSTPINKVGEPGDHVTVSIIFPQVPLVFVPRCSHSHFWDGGGPAGPGAGAACGVFAAAVCKNRSHTNTRASPPKARIRSLFMSVRRDAKDWAELRNNNVF